MRFVHEPSFFASLERIYDKSPEQYTNEENSFLPLLFIVMAVGCLFSDDGVGTLDVAGYEGAIGQGCVSLFPTWYHEYLLIFLSDSNFSRLGGSFWRLQIAET
jgi:hypothetical protein